MIRTAATTGEKVDEHGPYYVDFKASAVPSEKIEQSDPKPQESKEPVPSLPEEKKENISWKNWKRAEPLTASDSRSIWMESTRKERI